MEFDSLQEELAYITRKASVMKEISDAVSHKGFVRYEPGYLEDHDAFLEMNRRIRKETLVRLIEPDGTLSVLRPDITRAIVRRLVPRWEDGLVFRLHYDATMFTRVPSGKTREVRQFGIEILGDGSDAADLEVLMAAADIFARFPLRFRIVIGHNAFLRSVIKGSGLPGDAQRDLYGLLMRKDRDGLKIFIRQHGIQESVFGKLTMLEGTLSDIRGMLEGVSDDALARSMSSLSAIDDAFVKAGLEESVIFDLGLVTRYDHYEGIVFKGFLKGYPEAVLQGGRYDPLTRQFNTDVPAVGCSIDIEQMIREVTRHGA
jgi:ATP phosphoribosyltransferase regulatory subunit